MWKILWLIIFFIGFAFASSLYFFTVYRRQVRSGTQASV
jgi:hypothetical protein